MPHCSNDEFDSDMQADTGPFVLRARDISGYRCGIFIVAKVADGYADGCP